MKVPAIAVVNEEKKLVSTLSASDLRGVSSEKLENLLSPVMDFLQIQLGEKPPVPVTVTSTSSLEDAILKVRGDGCEMSYFLVFDC